MTLTYFKVRATIFILLFNLIMNVGSAQISEVGVFLGASYYLGDLNPTKHFNMSRPAGGFVHRYIINSHFAVKNSFYYGTLQGDDSQMSSAVQQNRNLHFKSSILDISSQIEFNFFPFEEKISNYSLSPENKYLFSPYVFIGISLFSFKPTAEINGTWYDLQPLGTEGQGSIQYYNKKKYSLTQLSIPIGVGIKFDITKKINLAFEWGIRKTYTDYIDDVSTTYADPIVLMAEKGPVASQLSDRSQTVASDEKNNIGRQRGNSKSKDAYVFTGLMITFKLINKYKEQKCPGSDLK